MLLLRLKMVRQNGQKTVLSYSKLIIDKEVIRIHKFYRKCNNNRETGRNRKQDQTKRTTTTTKN